MGLNSNNNTEKSSYLDDLSLDSFESNMAKVYIKNNIQEMNIYFAKDKNYLLNLLEGTKIILNEMKLSRDNFRDSFEYKGDIHRFIAIKGLIKLKEMGINDLEEGVNDLTISASSIESRKLPFGQEHNVFIYDYKDLMVEDLIKEMKDNNLTLEKVIDNLLLNEEFSDLTLPYQPKFDYIKDLVEKKLKSDELKNEGEVKKGKDLVQAEIMSHFIQNPNDNVMMSMKISKDPEDLCEMVDFEDAQYEDKNLYMLFNGGIGQKLGGITIKADETGEKGEEFTKELVIDRKTDSKGMLFIGKKGLKLEKVDFEDISKFESQFESYYVYRKEGNTYIKIIKNEIATVKVVNRDADIKHEINFKQDDLEKMNAEEILESQKELVKALKEQKENNTLDIFLEVIIKQMQIPEDAKNVVKDELRKLAESN